MKASDIFTPGSLPQYTYFDRSDLNLEFRLLEAIETKGIISSVAGPSKSGKTVLCESVIGQRGMLLIPGGGITSEPLFWDRIRTRLRLPEKQTTSAVASQGKEGSLKAEVGGSIYVAQAKAGSESKTTSATQNSQTDTYDGPDGIGLLEYIRDSEYTIVIDDFHYIEAGTQRSLAEQLKEAARQGTKIVIVSVTHRSDQAIRANPDLRGRVTSIDIPYWTPDELLAIPQKGLPLLNFSPDGAAIDRLVAESVSSPQLMQALCLQLCRDHGAEYTLPELKGLNAGTTEITEVLQHTAAMANCQTAFDILLAGPKTRGAERTIYNLHDGQNGDVYFVLLKAIAFGEPKLSLKYAEIKERTENLVSGDAPRGVGITEALQQMHRRVVERLGEDRVLEWDEEKETLSIPDPYFLYYLRWAEWPTR